MKLLSVLLAVLVSLTYAEDDGCCYKKTLECMQCRYPKRTWPLDFCLLEPEALKDDPWCNANVNKARFPQWPNAKPMNMGWYKRPFCCQEMSARCIMCNYPEASVIDVCMLHPREMRHDATCKEVMTQDSDFPTWPYLAPLRPEWFDEASRGITYVAEANWTEAYGTVGVVAAVGVSLVFAAFVVYRIRTKANYEETGSEALKA